MRRGLLAAALLCGACRGKDDARPSGVPEAGAPAVDPTGRSWKTPPTEDGGGGLVARRLPRVKDLGGRILSNPRIATITFAADDPGAVARLEQFGDTITRGTWWKAVVDAYCPAPERCVGDGRRGAHVHLADVLAPEIAESDVTAILEREVTSGRLAIDDDVILMTYLPRGVVLRGAAGTYCAGGPRGVHRSILAGGAQVPFAIIPRCGDDAEVTGSASHELLEATTSPEPAQRGFAFERDPDALGFFGSGVEPVDPCGLLTMDGHWTTADGFAVQRAWSNRAAARGDAWIVAERGDRPYVAAVPERAVVRLTKDAPQAKVVVEGAADRPVPRWSLSAFDLTGYQRRAACVEATVERATIGVGEKVTVSLTLAKDVAFEACTVGLVSSFGVVAQMWPLAIVTR